MRIILKEWTAGLDNTIEDEGKGLKMKIRKKKKMKIRFLVSKTGRKHGLNEQKCESWVHLQKDNEKFDQEHAEFRWLRKLSGKKKTKWDSSTIKAQVRWGQSFKNERDG